MKSRPIIFSSEMVLAILDGRKTQTRRIIKPQPGAVLSRIEHSDLWTYTLCDREWRCPYGQPGDRLWVKETWAHCADKEIRYRASGIIGSAAYGGIEFPGGVTLYPGAWKSPIFMPKRASRITLEIMGIRVERVQEISESDAEAEGVHGYTNAASPIDFFVCLWNKLNAKRGYSFESNPWCWVIEFKRVEEGLP